MFQSPAPYMRIWDYLWATALEKHSQPLKSVLLLVCVPVESNPQANKHCKPTQSSDEAYKYEGDIHLQSLLVKILPNQPFQIKTSSKPADPVSDEACAEQ